MPGYLTRDRLAVLAGLAAPLALAAVLVPFRDGFPNTDAALAMLLVVVAVAANGDRLAGVLAAVSTAVWFDFFLTQPYRTVQHHPPDRHRDHRPAGRDRRGGHRDRRVGPPPLRDHRRAGYLDGINNAARAVAAGGSAPSLIDQVGGQLVQLLSLRTCVFQYGVAGLPAGPPGCIATVRSLSGNGAGWGTARAPRRAPRWSCWSKAAASSRAGS